MREKKSGVRREEKENGKRRKERRKRRENEKNKCSFQGVSVIMIRGSSFSS